MSIQPAQEINRGDYVIATKYEDGDPGDQWSVGFYDGVLPKVTGDRHMVIDSKGQPFRGNGFRRVEKINASHGKWMVEHAPEIEKSDRNIWEWLTELKTNSV